MTHIWRPCPKLAASPAPIFLQRLRPTLAQEERGGHGAERQAQRGWVAPPVSPSPLLDQASCLRNQPPKMLHFFLQGLPPNLRIGEGWVVPSSTASPLRPTDTLSAWTRNEGISGGALDQSQRCFRCSPCCDSHQVGLAGCSPGVGLLGSQELLLHFPPSWKMGFGTRKCLLLDEGCFTPLWHLACQGLVGRRSGMVTWGVGPRKTPLGVWRLGFWCPPRASQKVASPCLPQSACL